MATNKSTAPKVILPKPIVIQDIILGGIADSPYIGQKNSVYSLVGFDVFSVPGVMLVSQKMTIESGAPTDDYYKILPCSDGNIYLFGKTLGNVYKNASGTYTLLGTVAPAAGNVGVLDAIEFNKKIYYMMQSRIGEWDFTGAFSGRNDSKFTFTNTNATYHPTLIVNNVLYIGDGNNVAQIDTTDTFTGAVFTTGFQGGQVVSALGKQITDLLIGTTISNNVPNCHVYRWDTWSISYTNDYPIPEVGVNCFIQAGEVNVAVQAGLSGSIYRLGASDFSLEKQIPSNFPTIYDSTHQAISNYPATAVLKGIPLFGMSNSTGDPCLEGVYSYGNRAGNYPTILTLPYPISTGVLTGITIWSMAVVGLTLYISRYDGTNYAIEKLDFTAKYASPYFETMILSSSKIWLDIYKQIVVNYQSMPSGTDIDIFYNANWAGYLEYGAANAGDIVNDTDRNEVYAFLQPRAKTIRFKIAPTVSGNNAPVIENVIIQPE